MAKSNDHVDQHKLFTTSVSQMQTEFFEGKPNPNLQTFVEKHSKERPYDPATDDYNVPAFDQAIETSKATAIYNMHTYWSKKPYEAIRKYISHYTRPGDLVIDPFCGSGGTGVAGKQTGRKVVLNDLSSFCTFISYNMCCAEDVELTSHEMDKILNMLHKEYSWIYKYKNHTVNSFIHSDKLKCIKCYKDILVYKCNNIGKSIYVCYECGQEWNSRSSSNDWCGSEVCALVTYSGRRLTTIDVTNEINDWIKETEARVLEELSQCNLKDTPIPKTLIDLGGRLTTTGTLNIKNLYSIRSQLLLYKLFRLIDDVVNTKVRNSIRFVVSSCLLNLTLMYQVRTGGGGKPGGGGVITSLQSEENYHYLVQSLRN